MTPDGKIIFKWDKCCHCGDDVLVVEKDYGEPHSCRNCALGNKKEEGLTLPVSYPIRL